ncbi:SusC/RagA family TonB-linked outer membrane protein [Puia dinghuensis]|uniref:SusC/RagA family TonB-linked outer membrane protein n=1 Tax=Puia dinghuensis TaxID=1792502 RepID=A0A8J2UFS2_9BACT|nr:SusC/RagA family TonB-linked outer membrane protein [Puia dinghuensis]GGB11651.1 SusC/RagA family TonB-linked outer membrane protein [Puia dinghuensis]
MKLTFLLVFVAALQVSANVRGQERVSLNLKQVEISRVLNSIEKLGTYRFLYNSRLATIRKKVTVDVKDMPVADLLKNMFNGTDLTFRQLDNNLIVVVSNSPEAQDIKITGKITGDNGEPLSGVSITVKGTVNGTSTDNNGNFTITVPENGRLIISYIGYETQDVAINKQSVINVKLVTANKSMDQVVVIGYGQATKRDLTGSIVKIDGKEISDKPNTNPVASLQSKVAGVYIVNNGTPGQAPDIRIRGTGSIGSIAPLYVVDGVFTYDISFVNPNDIESMEVLKDPSSLAIFGNQGANGVIIITTKRAKAGQSIFTFSTSTGVKQLVDKIKLANASQFNTLFAEENANNGVTNTGYLTLPDMQNNTDWINAVTRTGVQSANNLSIASATDNNKFNFSIGYTLDQGIVLHEQLQRVTATLNDEAKINRWLKIGVNFTVMREDLPYDATNELNLARQVMPQVSAKTKAFRVQNPYGSDTLTENLYSTTLPALQNSGVQNPLLDIYSKYNSNIDILYRYVGSVYAEINLMKHLTFRSAVYGDFSNESHRQYSPLYYGYDPGLDAPTLVGTQTKVVQDLTDTKNAQTDNILTYKNSFKNHNLTLIAGATTYSHDITINQEWVVPTDPSTPIPNDKRFWYPSAWPNSEVTNDPNKTYSYQYQPNWTVGFFGRALYNYDQKYYLNASVRRDGSSSFLSSHRWGNYWTLGAAWELTKENFMAGQKAFDFLKLKGSVGTLGDQSVPTGVYYPSYPGVVSNGQTVWPEPNAQGYGGAGFITSSSYGKAYIANPNLHWETVHQYEVGVELEAFQRRLHFEATYFHRRTDGAMGLYQITNQTQQLENLVNIQNNGQEFTASWYQPITKDLSVNLSGNITFIQNKVLGFDDPSFTYVDATSQNNGEQDSRTIAGQPIGEFYGYIVKGVFQSYAQILGSPVQSSLGQIRPGDLIYADIAGGKGGGPDGVVDSKDRTYIGNPSPKFTYGSSLTVNYKAFNLGVDIGGAWGNKIFRAWGSLEAPYQRVNYAGFQLDAWHGPGTSNWTPLLSSGDRANYVGSTYSIENGSYVRLRNIQIGYTVPARVFSKSSAIKALRVYINAQNLITWKNNSGYTPEYGGFTQYSSLQSSNTLGGAAVSFPPNPLQFGIDQGGGAIPRIISGGLNVTF